MNETLKNKVGFGRRGIIVTVVVVVIVAVLAIFVVLQATKKEPIKIGAIVSLSGPAAALVDLRDGLLLAVDEVNSWGGINSRKIELIVEDSKSNPEEGKKAFSRIEADHRPLLYVATISSVSIALAPLAEENKVVLAGLVVATPRLTKQNQWCFKYYSSAHDIVQSTLYILRHLKVRRLGVLYQDDEFGVNIFKLFREEFKRTGGTIISESFKVQPLDIKGKIIKLKDTEAIYIVAFSKPTKQIIGQLKRINYDGFILGSSSAINLRTTPEANGVYLPAPIIYNPDYPFAKEVKKKYEVRYGKAFNQFAGIGYDFVKLLAGLLEDKEITRESVRNILEGGFIYPGVFGNIDVKRGQRNITFPLHPAQIIDGKVKYLR